MRIAFMGTPDIARGVLDALLVSGHEVICVVTQPDRPNGRGNGITYSPVKARALEAGIDVLQPEKATEAGFEEKLSGYAPDIIVVVAFGQILKANILNLAKYGCVNVHASLLPKYRGASPIQWAIINGEKETGVTIMQMDPGIDTGDIILQEKISIDSTETAGSLFDKLTVLAGPVLIKALSMIESGTAVFTKQDDSRASYVSMLNKKMGRLDFNKTAIELERLIRGLIPWPGAYTYLNGKMIKIWKAAMPEYDDGNIKALPGQMRIIDNALFVGTEDGAVEILELQAEGKKRMPAYDFLRGAKIKDGTVLDKD